MAGPRALWKGHIKIDEISFAVALYTAASTSGRTSFHTVNRKTGNRVKREYVDEKTGKPVNREDQVKGYETSEGKYVILEPEEIEAVLPESDKVLSVDAFIPCREVDTVYFDKPYYIAPADQSAEDAFKLIRDGMKTRKVAALAKAVLFRRVRSLLVRPAGDGLIANTLNFDYEVRSSEKAFDDIPDVKIKKEMLDLASHIIGTLSGKFEPEKFEDRYDTALADLVQAKIEGRSIKRPKRRKEAKVVDLMEALRQSAKAAGKGKKSTASRKKSAA